MAKKGWLNIRNIPYVEHKVAGFYNKEISAFLRKNKLCSTCSGSGQYLKPGDYEYQIESSIRYGNIPALVEIKKIADEDDGISLSDLVREILERQICDKKVCPECNGSKFISR